MSDAEHHKAEAKRLLAELLDNEASPADAEYADARLAAIGDLVEHLVAAAAQEVFGRLTQRYGRDLDEN